jgi:hypothetical protein
MTISPLKIYTLVMESPLTDTAIKEVGLIHLAILSKMRTQPTYSDGGRNSCPSAAATLSGDIGTNRVGSSLSRVQ